MYCRGENEPCMQEEWMCAQNHNTYAVCDDLWSCNITYGSGYCCVDPHSNPDMFCGPGCQYSDQVRCTETNECVQACDGMSECPLMKHPVTNQTLPYGEDENPEVCKTDKNRYFKCLRQQKVIVPGFEEEGGVWVDVYIDSAQRCDGKNDCPIPASAADVAAQGMHDDGSDAASVGVATSGGSPVNTSSSTTFGSATTAGSPALLPYTADEDPSFCRSFDCGSRWPWSKQCPSTGRCLPLEQWCDGVNDCIDYSNYSNTSGSAANGAAYTDDEDPEVCRTFRCQWDYEKCPNGVQCVHKSRICNGVIDCHVSTDPASTNVSATSMSEDLVKSQCTALNEWAKIQKDAAAAADSAAAAAKKAGNLTAAAANNGTASGNSTSEDGKPVTPPTSTSASRPGSSRRSRKGSENRKDAGGADSGNKSEQGGGKGAEKGGENGGGKGEEKGGEKGGEMGGEKGGEMGGENTGGSASGEKQGGEASGVKRETEKEKKAREWEERKQLAKSKEKAKEEAAAQKRREEEERKAREVEEKAKREEAEKTRREAEKALYIL
ncbi:unnamed protein product [Closterium sp. Yama58-4]|nr:unnamed protein product [Closterium sp. Yama58-4]